MDLFVEEICHVKYCNFFGSEGEIIQFLQTEDLRNDQCISNFKCYQCTNTFTTTCMLSNIGNLIDNLESSLSRKLLPTKCKSCRSSKVIFERLSGYFQSIPVLLTVEIGHLPNMSETRDISDNDTQPTINHNERTFHNQLAGSSVHLGNHFYTILCNKREYYKFDGILTTILYLTPLLLC